MKSKFHINMILQWNESGDMYHWVEGNKEFDTRDAAESALIALRKVSESAGIPVEYRLAEEITFSL